MSNTLLNYFKKADNKSAPNSPASVLKKEPTSLNSPKIDKENAKPKQEAMQLDEDEDEIVQKPKRLSDTKDSPRNVKRRRLMIQSDSDSEPETKKKPSKAKDSSPEVQIESESSDEEMEEDLDEEEEEEIKLKSKKKPAPKNKNLSLGKVNSPKTPKTKTNANTPSSAAKPSLSGFQANFDEDSSQPIEGRYKHLNYEFLQEDKIK